MNRLAAFAAAAAITLAAPAIAWAQSDDNKVTLQLKWVTQSQFAGYYVAQDQGFYEDEGLDVEIKPGGPDIAPVQVLAGGGADVVVEWMPSALAAREKGVPLVNIAQPFKSSGMMLTCRKETGITEPADFKGKTLGVWFFGNEYPFLSWMSELGIKTDGSDDGVQVLKQGFNVDPLLQKQADCISTMTYNEYWQVIDAGLTEDDLVVFKYEDQGVATLEDGLYVLEENLGDEAFKERMVKFVRASMKGWKYAEANPDEAADDRARKRCLRCSDRRAPEAHDGRNRQTDRRFQRCTRRGRLPTHGEDPAVCRRRAGHHGRAAGRMDVGDYRPGTVGLDAMPNEGGGLKARPFFMSIACVFRKSASQKQHESSGGTARSNAQTDVAVIGGRIGGCFASLPPHAGRRRRLRSHRAGRAHLRHDLALGPRR